MNECIDISKLKNADRIKLRLLQVKTKLPTAGYVALFKHYFPEHPIDKITLSHIWNCKIVNESVVEKFEQIADHLQQE